MVSQSASPCGICAGQARSEIDFRLGVPEAKRRRHNGADAVALQMPLCPSCEQRAYKHLTRFFGKTHFRPIGD